jgi:catechol 2,3-dioxygenase-like lactoylglutathione lyase family enzyme
MSAADYRPIQGAAPDAGPPRGRDDDAMPDPAYVLDHVGLRVADPDASRRFFEAALAPLGFAVVMEVPGMPGAGFGLAGRPSFWVTPGERPSGPLHIAFHAADRARVDAFHAAALAAGGTDNGAPGLRPHYHPNYYAAFVLDLDGNNVEAVCHVPEG